MSKLGSQQWLLDAILHDAVRGVDFSDHRFHPCFVAVCASYSQSTGLRLSLVSARAPQPVADRIILRCAEY